MSVHEHRRPGMKVVDIFHVDPDGYCEVCRPPPPLMGRAREQADGLDNWADVLDESSAKGILMLRAAAKTLRELAPNAQEGT